jgi:rare lipoprotein A (peptidoglycan hydrolase)
MRMLILPIAAILLMTQQSDAQDARSGKTIRQEGQASYFKAGQDGNTQTKSGEPVAPQDYTAASRDLPLGTVATVTNQKTGKSVDVRINDRGPTRMDRIIVVWKKPVSPLSSSKRTRASSLIRRFEASLRPQPGKQNSVSEIAA